jgi:hypothetical protein
MQTDFGNSEKSQHFRKFSRENQEDIKKLLQSISFEPVWFNPETGTFQNIHLLFQMLPVLEQYADIFGNDYISLEQDYNEWLDSVMGFIQQVAPYFFVALEDGQPTWLVWASNWESFKQHAHSVEIGGLAKRGVLPLKTKVMTYCLLDMLFETTDVNIVRAECEESNRAVRLSLMRTGFSHPEKRRCIKVKNGQEVTGIILSMTRSEWEQLHNEEQ